MVAYLEGQVVAFANIPAKLNDGLHTLNLALDDSIKVLFLDFREAQEMNRANIPSGGIFGDILLQ